MQIAVWGWDTANKKAVEILVDSLGHVQTDVLTSALPSGAATLAKQTDQLTKLNSIITKLAGGLPAALDSLALKVREQGTPEKHIYGWDSANWKKLLVEDSTNSNLRVRLYDGANPIGSVTSGAFAIGTRGLPVYAVLGAWIGTNLYRELTCEVTSADNLATNRYGLLVRSHLYGFDDTTWDRLRTYGTGILKVGRADVGLLDVRKTAIGQVGATGARKLYWLVINPSAGSSVLELTDATAGGAGVKYDCFHTNREAHTHPFDPPLEFSNGIYLETFTNITSVIFGYL